jgi:hypothetical protein
MSRAVALGFVTAAVVMAAFYGLGAFIAWEANPGQWSNGLRGFMGVCALVISTAAGCITAGETA